MLIGVGGPSLEHSSTETNRFSGASLSGSPQLPYYLFHAGSMEHRGINIDCLKSSAMRCILLTLEQGSVQQYRIQVVYGHP